MATLPSTPAFRDPVERGRWFAGRRHDLAELLRAVRENGGRNHNQHVLVLGPRGMGKTTLLLRTVDLVREEAGLAAVWFPLVAPEELYLAGSLGEVWLELVNQLASATGESEHQRAFGALKAERDDDRLAAAALGHLLDFADRRQRRLLLVVENLQLLFGEQLDGKDAWGFREVLLHERRVMVLGSAPRIFPGLRRPDAALYELFLLHPLEPMDQAESLALWRAAGGPELGADRMWVMELLADGNPYHLSTLASGAPSGDSAKALAGLLDAHADHLRLTIEALPALERKVFAALAAIWDEAPASRVAEEARLDVNVASAQLARLEGRGFVLSRRQGRAKTYHPADPLLGFHILLRRPGSGTSRLLAALAFLDLWVRDHPPAADTLTDFRGLVSAQAFTDRLVASALHLASAGAGQDILETLAGSALAPQLEPLLLALRRHLGQEIQGPALLLAIAEDLVQAIRSPAALRP